MKSKTMEFLPKRTFKLIYVYLISPLVIICPAYILYSLIVSGGLSQLPFLLQGWLVLTFSCCILAGLYTLIAFSRATILMDDSGIISRRLLNTELPYDSIQKIQVRKNGLTMSDGSFRNRISLDFLFDRDKVISHLVSKIPNTDKITFEGDEKEIEKYFGIRNQPDS